MPTGILHLQGVVKDENSVYCYLIFNMSYPESANRDVLCKKMFLEISQN